MKLFFYKLFAKGKVFFQSKKILNQVFEENKKIFNTKKVKSSEILKIYNLFFSKNKNIAKIELKKVCKTYENGFKAINNFSLKIQNHEFVSLLGPSGCGKTTILRMIAGLEMITKGSFLINNLDHTSSLPSDRKLAMVFQNYALYPYMSVKENISFGLKIGTWKNSYSESILKKLDILLNPSYLEIKKLLIDKKKIQFSKKNQINNLNFVLKTTKRSEKEKREDLLKQIQELKLEQKDFQIKNKAKILEIDKEIKQLKSNGKNSSQNKDEIKKLFSDYVKSIVVWKKSIQARVENVAKIVGINDYLDRRPRALSGGQRQRVALARAISKDVPLFLFDEPLSNLDAKLRASMRTEIRELHEKLSATSIFVTHDQIEAMTMSDKIVIMNKGYIQQVGTSKELFNNSANIFVADFIGTPRINFLVGTLHEKNKVSINSKKGSNALIAFSNKSSKVQAKIDNWNRKDKVILGIRPQNIILDPILVSQAKKQNVFEGKIKSIENIGHENVITIESNVLGSNFKILSGKYFFGDKGKKIKFLINPNSIQIFDYKTGLTISSEINQETLAAMEIEKHSLEEKEKNDIILMSKNRKKSILNFTNKKNNLEEEAKSNDQKNSPLFDLRKDN